MHEERHVANPFEDENGVFHVLVNDEGQHSLWPSFVEVPSGWTIILKSESRTACLEFIERNDDGGANEFGIMGLVRNKIQTHGQQYMAVLAGIRVPRLVLELHWPKCCMHQGEVRRN